MIGCGSKRVQQFTHQVAAAVVEPLDLAGVIHRVLGCVLRSVALHTVRDIGLA